MTAMRADIAMHQAPKTARAQLQKGTTLLEFALVLPLFLVILFGMITFSVALYNKTVLTMATREGARAGAMFVPDRTVSMIDSAATATALQFCQNNLISFGPAMTCNVTPTIQDSILTVTANGTYTGIYVFSGMVISAQTSMRLE